MDITFLFSFDDNYYRSNNNLFKNFVIKFLTYIIFPIQILLKIKKIDKKFDKIIVITSPFYLPTILVNRLKVSKKIILYNDIYPEALVIKKIISRKSIFYKYLNTKLSNTLKNSDTSVFITEEHLDVVKNNITFKFNNTIIHVPGHKNAQKKIIFNSKIRFIYSGTLGYFHNYKNFINFFKKISMHQSIKFYFNTSGSAKKDFEKKIRNTFPNELSKTIFLGDLLSPQNYDEIMLKCSIGIIFQDSGSSRILFPSKFASMLLSGQAILSFSDNKSYIAKLIKEYNLGWVVDHNTNDFEKLISEITNFKLVQEKRKNALRFGKKKFSLKSVSGEWFNLLNK